MQDVQKAFNELFDWKAKLDASNWDLKGKRITNAGTSKDPSDYVTKSELPVFTQTPTPANAILYTITFNPPDGAAANSISPPFRVGVGRSGSLYQAWVAVTGAPTGSNLTVNFQYNGVNILATDLVLAVGAFSAVTSSFAGSLTLAQGAAVTMILTSANSAMGVTGGVVVQITGGINTGQAQ